MARRVDVEKYTQMLLDGRDEIVEESSAFQSELDAIIEWADEHGGAYRVKEACDICGVSRQRIHVLIHRDNLPTAVLGNTLLIGANELMRWVNERDSRLSGSGD